MGLVLAASRRRYSWDRIRTSPALHTNLRAWDKQCAALRGLANDVDQIPIQQAAGRAPTGRARVVAIRIRGQVGACPSSCSPRAPRRARATAPSPPAPTSFCPRAATAATSSPPWPPACSSAKTASHPRAKTREAEAIASARATSVTRLPTTPLCGGNGTRTARVRGTGLFAPAAGKDCAL